MYSEINAIVINRSCTYNKSPKYDNVTLGCLEILITPWRYSEATWIWSWATSARWPYLSRLDQAVSRGAFQLHPHCDARLNADHYNIAKNSL